jgi:hypothetical protein
MIIWEGLHSGIVVLRTRDDSRVACSFTGCHDCWSYGMVWYGMVWYEMGWYGMVWYEMGWYGMRWWDGSKLRLSKT